MEWDAYGPGNDPRCEHCAIHSRLRAVGGVRVVEQPEGDRAEPRVDADGLTFAVRDDCGGARRRSALGLDARARGRARRERRARRGARLVRPRRLAPAGCGVGDVLDATRVVDETGATLWEGPAARRAAARAPATVLGADVARPRRSRARVGCVRRAAPTRSTWRAASSRAAAGSPASSAPSPTTRRARSRASTRRCTPTAARTSPASCAGSRPDARRRGARRCATRCSALHALEEAVRRMSGPRPPRRAALVLRRRRPRDRDRRAAARAARPAGLRPPPDRPQRARRAPPRAARRRLRRGRGGDPGGRDLRSLGARRRARGEGERAARAACASSTRRARS